MSHHIKEASGTHTAVTVFLTANQQQLTREELKTQKKRQKNNSRSQKTLRANNEL
jgi:hypothetical protein